MLNKAQIRSEQPPLATGSASDAKSNSLRVSAIYRDPQDVRTVIQLARSGIVLTLLLLISVTGNFYQYYRRPDRIVVDKSSGRVVEINDRDYGETEAVEFGPERLTDADKKYILPLNISARSTRSTQPPDPKTSSAPLG